MIVSSRKLMSDDEWGSRQTVDEGLREEVWGEKESTLTEVVDGLAGIWFGEADWLTQRHSDRAVRNSREGWQVRQPWTIESLHGSNKERAVLRRELMTRHSFTVLCRMWSSLLYHILKLQRRCVKQRGSGKRITVKYKGHLTNDANMLVLNSCPCKPL